MRKHFKNKFNTVQNRGELDWRFLFCYWWRIFCNLCCTFTSMGNKNHWDSILRITRKCRFLSSYLVFSIAKRSRFNRNFGHYLAKYLSRASTKFGWAYFYRTCSTQHRSRCNFSYNGDRTIHHSNFGSMVTWWTLESNWLTSYFWTDTGLLIMTFSKRKTQ